ncbi:hypothetical protein DL96DRAFT_1712859 [Flagelloscypha sp. PMI_526]|nr:hypothetical protein DL96DRAFT_1712859 [Flagelloscypha sp. PMI_526]
MFLTALLAVALLPLGVVGAGSKYLAGIEPGISGDNRPALQARSGRIEGLLDLDKRQYYCDAGYFMCRNRCCPGGSKCCSSGASICCYASETCYSIGCCPNGHKPCGNRCIPNNANCCGGGWYCPSGETCLSGNLCSGGGGNDDDDDDITTTRRTTSEVTHSTTFFSTNTFTSTATLPAPTRSPTGTSVSLTGPDIKWEGSWELTTSPCDTSKEAKSASGSGQPSTEYSMTYTIAKGASVQLSLDSSENCKYTVTAGGVSESFTGPQKNSSQAGVNANCWFTYTASEKLSIGQQSWELSVKVEGPLTSGKRGLDERQSSTDWWLQVNQINILEDSSSTASSSANSLTPSASTVSSGASNGGSTTMTAGSLWNLGLLAPLIRFFV